MTQTSDVIDTGDIEEEPNVFVPNGMNWFFEPDDLYPQFTIAQLESPIEVDGWNSIVEKLFESLTPVEDESGKDTYSQEEYVELLEYSHYQAEADRLFLLHWLVRSYHESHKPLFADADGQLPQHNGISNQHHTGGALAAIIAYFTGICEVPLEFKIQFARQKAMPNSQFSQSCWKNTMLLYDDPAMPSVMHAWMRKYLFQLKLVLFGTEKEYKEEGFVATKATD